MKHNSRNESPSQMTLDEIGITSDNLTGRGGLALFGKYVEGIGILPHLDRLFGGVKKTGKGAKVPQIFKQMLCFFVDGTSLHITYFDELARDKGYAGALETAQEDMISSHTVKRFLRSFWWPRIYLFRRLLLKLFLWRIDKTQPTEIILGVDTSVFDNNDALKRHGVQPTYKKVKGFQPLLLTWNHQIIDAVFRGGKKHSNSGDTVVQMFRHVVKEIRKHYRQDVPIVIRFDAGFFDQEIFAVLDGLGVGFTGTGKIYKDTTQYARGVSADQWQSYDKGDRWWRFFELGDRRGSWSCFRRAFYLQPLYEGKQQLLEFARPETILYTNLGMGGRIDELLSNAGKTEFFAPEKIIELQHDRGADELVFRSVKDFAGEKLPCKRFNMNAAWFYTMLVSFFLFECFKEDVSAGILPVTAYPTRFRRTIIDFAAKIVRHGGKTILKVTQAVHSRLNLDVLWQRATSPPVFAWL